MTDFRDTEKPFHHPIDAALYPPGLLASQKPQPVDRAVVHRMVEAIAAGRMREITVEELRNGR